MLTYSDPCRKNLITISNFFHCLLNFENEFDVILIDFGL